MSTTPQPFDAITLAGLRQGDFAVALLGANHPDALSAQENAAHAQSLLMVEDENLRASIQDVKARQNALFDALKNPTELEDRLDKAAVAAARLAVDSGKGIFPTHPAVPGYAILLNRFLDRDLAQGVMCAQTGMRILILLNDPTQSYPRANVNEKFDPHDLFAAGNKLNALIDSIAAVHAPMTKSERAPYIDAARAVMSEGLKKIRASRYEFAADGLEPITSDLLISSPSRPGARPPGGAAPNPGDPK